MSNDNQTKSYANVLIARASGGVQTWSFDPTTNRWQGLGASPSPRWGDDGGWNSRMYYQTIQCVTTGACMVLIGRTADGIDTFKFDPLNNAWTLWTTASPAWNDKGGWSSPRYFSTIQCVAAGNTFYLIGRGSNGIRTFKLGESGTSWTEVPTEILFSDAAGWGYPEYYSTIRVAAVGSRLYLVARGSAGIHTYCLDTETNTWSQVGDLGSPAWADGQGWNSPEYYSTIQLSAFKDNPVLIARSATGIETYLLDGGKWASKCTAGPDWSDDNGWAAPERYATIQAVTADNRLFLIGRNGDGVETHEWDGTNWQLLCKASPDWPDKGGWNAYKYYSTIEAKKFVGSSDTPLHMVARSADGMDTYGLEKDKSGAWAWVLISTANPSLSDTSGWYEPQYFSTISLSHSSARRMVIKDPDMIPVEFYAITDVKVTSDKNAPGLEAYTGVPFSSKSITGPYIPGVVGERLAADNVNTGIGGSTTTIWVKYERVRSDSTQPVLADIAAVHWPSWVAYSPSGEKFEGSADLAPDGWCRAGGKSNGVVGGLTTGTEQAVWDIGLCVRYAPMSTVKSFVSNLCLAFDKNKSYPPTQAWANGGTWTMRRGKLDIHSGVDGEMYLCVAQTLVPVQEISFLQYNTHLFEGSLAAFAQETLGKVTKITKTVYRDTERRTAIINSILNSVDGHPDIVCLEEVWGSEFRGKIVSTLGIPYPYLYVMKGEGVSRKDREDIFDSYLGPQVPDKWKGTLKTAFVGSNLTAIEVICAGFSVVFAVGVVIPMIEKLKAIELTNGLMIFSKYEIDDCVYTSYDMDDPEDRLGKKGVIVFSIRVPVLDDASKPSVERILRIGMTHAPTTVKKDGVVSSKADAYQAIQTAAEKTFGNSTYDAVLLGDFNVHYYRLPAECTTGSDGCDGGCPRPSVHFIRHPMDECYQERQMLQSVIPKNATDIVAKCLPNAEDCYTDWRGNTLTMELDKVGDQKLHLPKQETWERIDYVYFAPATARENQFLTLLGATTEVPKDWKIDDDDLKKQLGEKLDLSDHNPVLVTLKLIT